MEKIDAYTTIKNWGDLVQVEAEYSRDRKHEWIFRGEVQRRTLKTTLQRVCEEFNIRGRDIARLESHLLHEFKRVYPVYSPLPMPEPTDTIYWVSLMRHYGAPTRFLDFSFSFFIAAYFALEHAVESRHGYEPSAIWAINKTWITRHFTLLLEKIGGEHLCNQWGLRQGAAYEKVFWDQEPPLRFVVPLNPYSLHQRLRVQQGLFLSPGDVSVSFEQNVIALNDYKHHVRLIHIDHKGRQEILWKLHEAGISRESLFPGLDGFAQSLHTAGALLLLRRLELEKTGGRVPTGLKGEFMWADYLSTLKGSGPRR